VFSCALLVAQPSLLLIDGQIPAKGPVTGGQSPVGEGVGVNVLVGVGVNVLVGVGVEVLVGDGVNVLVDDGVGVVLAVGDGVSEGPSAGLAVTSCGGLVVMVGRVGVDVCVICPGNTCSVAAVADSVTCA